MDCRTGLCSIVAALFVAFVCWGTFQIYSLSNDVAVLKSDMTDYSNLRNELNYIMGALNERGFHINTALLETSAKKGISQDLYLHAEKLIETQPTQSKIYLTSTLGFSSSEADEVIESTLPTAEAVSTHGNVNPR